MMMVGGVGANEYQGILLAQRRCYVSAFDCRRDDEEKEEEERWE
jgi:hypothetical protein